MRPLRSRLSQLAFYSGFAAGILGLAIITMGGTVFEDSSHNRFLSSVGGIFGEIALVLVIYAVPAVYFGRKGVLALEAENAAKKEPIQPLETTRGK